MPQDADPERSTPDPAPDVQPICQVCGEPIDQRAVWCVDCDTPHHRDCFAWNGRCAVYACTGMHYRRQRKQGPAVTWIDVRREDGVLTPQGFVVDHESRRERGLFWLAGGAFALALASLGVPAFAASMAALGTLLALLRFGMRDYRIVDGKSRTIWLHRSCFRWRRVDPERGFEVVRRVTLAGRFDPQGWRGEPGYHWSVRLDLTDGPPLTVTASRFVPYDQAGRDVPPPELRETGRRLREILGVSLHEERQGAPGAPGSGAPIVRPAVPDLPPAAREGTLRDLPAPFPEPRRRRHRRGRHGR